MKLNYSLLLLLFLFALSGINAQIKIGDNPQQINPHALLELESTDQGLLLPRLTNAQRDVAFKDNIPEGLLIFNTDSRALEVYLSEKGWLPVSSSASGSVISFELTDDHKLIFNGDTKIDLTDYYNANQKLLLEGNILKLGDGSSVDLSSLGTVGPAGPPGPPGPITVGTDSQTLSLTATGMVTRTTLTLENGNAISLTASGGLQFLTTSSSIEWIGSAGALEKLTEGSNTGYRLADSDPDNFGDIGNNAVDLSFSTTASTTLGALGDHTFVAGFQNSAIGEGTTVSGGLFNTASGAAVVGGGLYNNALGAGSIVTGGATNTAMGNIAVVGGGTMNNALGGVSVIAGGAINTASGEATVVSGGQSNTASGIGATIGGGLVNSATGTITTIGGGSNNTVRGGTLLGGATVGGGAQNTAFGDGATVAGGLLNTASADYATVSGGFFNTAASFGEWVGGLNAELYTPSSTTAWNKDDRIFAVGNGQSLIQRSNALTILKDGRTGIGTSMPTERLEVAGTVSATAFVGDGSRLTGVGTGTAVLGKLTEDNKTGYRFIDSDPANFGDIGNNAVDLSFSTTASTTYGALGDHTFVAGFQNSATGERATISGGSFNTASANSAVVGGGSSNTASGTSAVVGGGWSNTASGISAVVGGGDENTASGTNVVVGGGWSNTASAEYAVVGGGQSNTASGRRATVSGGYRNTAASYGEWVGGLFVETYTPASTTAWNKDDRIFAVGNGQSLIQRSNALTILKDGRTGIGTSMPTERLEVAGMVSATAFVGDGSRLTGITGGSGALEKITDGSNTGYRLADSDPANFGDIGNNAVDLSFSGAASNAYGATGAYSTVGGGDRNTASGTGAVVGGGNSNTASGTNAMVGGGESNTALGDRAVVGGGRSNTASNIGAAVGGGWSNTASGTAATVGGGSSNTASGSYATVSGGLGNTAASYGEWVGGLYAETYTATSTTAWDKDDRIFAVGNGQSTTQRSNALTILKDGRTGIGTTTPKAALEVANDIIVHGYNLGRGNGGNGSNLAFGRSALASNTNGQWNVAVGLNSLQKNTTGHSNLAVGLEALENNVGGSYNTAVGIAALDDSTGDRNTGIGYGAMRRLNSGSRNVAIGNGAGGFFSSGSNSYAINTTSNESIYVGNSSSAGANGTTNEIVIGASAIGLGSNTVVLGNSSITTTALKGQVGIGTSMPTEQLEVVGTVSATAYAGRSLSLNSGGTKVASSTGLYANTVTNVLELVAYDGAGNESVISPHHFSLIDAPSEDMAWSFYSKNTHKNKQVNVDMMKTVRLVEQLSGQKLVHLADMAGRSLSETPAMEMTKMEKEMLRLQAEAADMETKVEKLQAENAGYKAMLESVLQRLESLEKKEKK